MIQLFRPSYRVEECLDALRPVFESGWTGPGPNCKEFEKEWNDFTGSKYSHFVSSCTAALHIALKILDLPKGSKICTTGLTFISTNAVILYEDMHPVFCDISEDYLSLDPDDVKRRAVENNAKAVIWVHYGGSVDPRFEDFVLWANDNNIKIIEDCAHAAGAFYKSGYRVGCRKDTISCFSYQAVKNLPTFDGGLISVPSKKMLDRVKKLAWMGIDKDTFSRTNSNNNEVYKWFYDVPEVGWKYNGNDVSAALARVSLKYLDIDNAYRSQLESWYWSYLDDRRCELVEPPMGSSHHLIVIKVKDREKVIKTLKENDIAPGVHYLPNMFFRPFKKFYKIGSCPFTEGISKQIISLPNHLGVTNSDVKIICGIVNECLS